jgi:SAM-dependent methyltransferase
VARSAATNVNPGQVTGLDLNAGMLAVARSLPNDGTPINWTEGSALDMPFPSDHFDVVLCQQGLQFFPDQPGALRELHRVLREGGRAALSVYSPIERTPGANAFVQALDQVLGPEASRIKRGEHSPANPGQLESLLRAAGFGIVVVSTVQQTIVFLCARLCPLPVSCDADDGAPERQERARASVDHLIGRFHGCNLIDSRHARWR